MKALAAVVAGVALLSLALLAFAPASLADRRIAEASAGRVRLAEATGTLVHGRGWLADPRGRWRFPVEWRLDAGSLLRGVIEVAFNAPASESIAGRATFAEQEAAVHGLRIEVPAAAALAFSGVDSAAIGGILALRADSLLLAPGRASGSLEARWQRARAAVLPGMPVDLGTVTLRLVSTARGLSGPLEAHGGTLVASGIAEIDSQSARIDVELTPSADAPDALRAALAVLGRADARGTVRVTLSHKL